MQTRFQIGVYLCIHLVQIVQIMCSKDLPSYYPRCYRDDPHLNDCLINATEQVRPYLQKGTPELDTPPLSPFVIPEVTMQQGTDAINYKVSLKNLVVTGLDNYKFTRFEFDPKSLNFIGSVDISQLYLEGNYSVSGKILAVPIEGNGLLYADITNCNGTLTQSSKLVTKRGQAFLEPNKVAIKIHIGDVKSHLGGLFGGNDQLAAITNRIIQDNSKELVDEVKPAIEEVMTKIMRDLIFKSVARVPYDKLFPIGEQQIKK